LYFGLGESLWNDVVVESGESPHGTWWMLRLGDSLFRAKAFIAGLFLVEKTRLLDCIPELQRFH
jgi:hypothetical protein